MASFPVLRTGAVLQFPATRARTFSTGVIQFVDGTEQRYRNYSSSYRQWIIQLTDLDEAELQTIRTFISETGTSNLFAFTDPWDGAVYPTCRIAGADFPDVLNQPGQASTSFVVRECRV